VNQRSATAASDLEQMHEVSIYDQTRALLDREFDSDQLNAILLRDSYMVSLLAHENLTAVNFHTKNKRDIHDLCWLFKNYSECDVMERCMFARENTIKISTDMMNRIMLGSVNLIAHTRNKTTNTIKFTQQFTKLSTQVSTRKKLDETRALLGECSVHTLAFLHKFKIPSEKPVTDIVKRFAKEFAL
jgi:hypothetical protein